MTDSAKSHFYWFLRRNERDVVGLYQFTSSYVQYATGTCMLNFGYWLKGSSGSLKMLQKLVEMKGKVTVNIFTKRISFIIKDRR